MPWKECHVEDERLRLIARLLDGEAMKSDELVEDADHPPTRERHAHRNLQPFPIPFIDDRQQPDATAVVERLRHEIERPGLVQYRRRREWLPDPSRHPPGRPSRQIEPQRAVHAMHVLVVPGPAFDPQPIKELPEAPARIARHGVRQRCDHRGISPARRLRRLVVRRAREPHHAAGSLDRELVLAHQHLSDLSLRERPYSFRFRTSLMAQVCVHPGARERGCGESRNY